MEGRRSRGPRGRRTSGDTLRLEGLVVEKRMGHVESTRYLVMDLRAKSIAVYKKPPPKDEFDLVTKKKRSLPSLPSLGRSKSDETGAGGGKQLSYENLAHISRVSRHFSGAWDPKFTVPATVDWKIRDVENDDTLFYLVLPADFKKKDSDAEVFTRSMTGHKQISYSRLLGSVEEDGPADEGIDSDRRHSDIGIANSQRSSMESLDDRSVTSTTSLLSSTSKSPRGSMFRRKFKRDPSSSDKQEVVYMFRVLLDGNEKFIWLQAAAELGRLSDEKSVRLVSTGVDVTKKIFVLPGAVIGGMRSSATELRYAEWARLIDQKKSVSNLNFDVHDVSAVDSSPQDDDDPLADGVSYDSKRLVKVIPTYAYRNRRMTEKDLYYEMTTTSEKWEDFRGQVVGDREEETIGCLHAEILACHGLPKLDKLSSTDGVCYFVCGPYAFASDVIDGFLSPVWPSKSRRACIFPLFHAYQRLFVGIFDDDGPGRHDDFAGRVVVDLARLRPNSTYDLFLPLRQYQNTFVKKSRGVIHLRLRVQWDDERKALLSYLKRPRKTEELGNAVTLNCADYKAFRNAVLTVQGKDVPGRYKQMVQKGLQREMKLYKMSIQTGMQQHMMDIVFYANPSTSLCIFAAWMHCVYSNSMAYVPVYVVVALIALLLRNYFKYAMNEKFNFGFTPITISEMFKVLFFGGPNTRHIKPINVAKKISSAKTTSGVRDENEEEYRMDGDHMEFPFSEAGRYPKKTIAEASVDASAIFAEDDDENATPSGAFSSLLRKGKKGAQAIQLPKANRDDDDDEEDDEFGLMVASSMPRPNGSAAEATNGENTGQNAGIEGSKVLKRRASHEAPPATLNKVAWKRVKDTRGLPEQDASKAVKARKTLKEELIHNKNLMHKYSQQLFDDRMFIVNEGDPGHTNKEEEALNQAIGTNKYNSPIIAKVAEYVAPGLEMLKVGLSAWRAVFNLFTWRDPYLTSLFLFGATVTLLVLLVFPWRLFFFVMGLGAVGPQNWVLRIAGKLPPKKKSKGNASTKSDKKSKKVKQATFHSTGSSSKFQFHNHLTTNAGVDERQRRSEKSTSSVHRAVVPNSPLISRRFYDWPPNPSQSQAEIYNDE